MKVKELIEFLKKVDDDASVLVDISWWNEEMNLIPLKGTEHFATEPGHTPFVVLYPEAK